MHAHVGDFFYLWNNYCNRQRMSLKKLLFLLLVLSAGYGANAQEKIAPEQLQRIIVIKARCLDNNKADYYYYIQIYNGKTSKLPNACSNNI